MNNLLRNTLVSFSLLIFTVGIVLPGHAYARYRTNPLQNKINDLDNDPVEDLPVPLLFGTTPQNLTRNFGDPRPDGRTHEGLDILAPRGTPIVSPTEAVVTRIGDGASSGLYVSTANPGGESMVFMHLDSYADINEGDVLKVGEVIGFVGNTGNASGGVTHLHFELHDDNGNPTDPFPRLTRIFPLQNKIDGLEQVLDEMNASEGEKFVDFVVTHYRSDLLLAQTLNIELSTEITEALVSKVVQALGITRTLKLGMSGDDVKAMQTALGVSADGSFGPKTKSAVVAFQLSKGLVGDGVFGPASRNALMGTMPKSTIGCTATTLFSPTTGAKCS